MRNDSDIKIFSGTSSKDFTERVCRSLDIKQGECSTLVFSEGNIYVKIKEKVRGKDVYIVQTIAMDPNNEFMELLFWIDACKRSGVNSVTAIIPYFSYAKADKKDEPRVSIRARVCADCLEAAGVDRVVTMDLHSPQIQGFFKKPVDHLYAAKTFCNMIESMGLENYSIVSPDEGFAKNARYYANHLNVPLVIGNKQRLFHDERAEILGLMGEVEGRGAVIIDDFSISCGTIVEVAKTLRNMGAKDIYAFVTHGLFSPRGVEAVENSPIKELYATDTVINPLCEKSEKIKILSVSGIFAQAIKIIHEKESLSELFL